MAAYSKIRHFYVSILFLQAKMEAGNPMISVANVAKSA